MLRTAATAAALSLCLCATACGGDATGSSSITGTVSGLAFSTIGDSEGLQMSATCTRGTSTGSVSMIGVAITDTGGQCAALQAGAVTKNTQMLSLIVATGVAGTTAPALGTGTYSIGTSQTTSSYTITSATVEKRDAACGATVSQEATSGTITISALSGSSISGSVNLTFPSGTLSGSFNAAVCSVSQSVAQSFCSDTSTSTCQ
jgi:hypothetical protein